MKHWLVILSAWKFGCRILSASDNFWLLLATSGCFGLWEPGSDSSGKLPKNPRKLWEASKELQEAMGNLQDPLGSSGNPPKKSRKLLEASGGLQEALGSTQGPQGSSGNPLKNSRKLWGASEELQEALRSLQRTQGSFRKPPKQGHGKRTFPGAAP